MPILPRLATSRLITSVLVIGFACCGAAGCSAATGRPDAEVARLVEAEERRVAADRAAQLGALASTDLAYLELAAAGATIETIALLYVPQSPASARAASVPAVAPEDTDPDWVEGPPPSWLDQPWPHSQAMDPEGAGVAAVVGRRSDGVERYGPLTVESGDRGDRKSGKPKIRMDLFKLNFRGRPVSLSTSLKGLKGVQFKATIKM